MNQFFDKCGPLLGHAVTKRGREVVVTFTYENGTAAYDGREWTFSIKKA